VEYLVPHSLGVHDESSLRLRAQILIFMIVVRRIHVLLLYADDLLVELTVNLGQHFQWLQSARIFDCHDAPVVKPALPELSEIN
jgi:hypothetical protein